MGKKLSQSSQYKISKSKPCENKKHQQCLNSLVKVLKPKVYITNSSTFKSLVQELTGNGNIINGANPLINITSSSSPPPPPPPLPFPVIEIDNHENSTDFSFDSSQANTTFIPNNTTFGFQESTSPDYFSFNPSQLVHSSINSIPTSLCDYYLPVQIGNNEFKGSSSSAAFSFDSPSTESWMGNDNNIIEEMHYSQYKEIESWLLEMDPTVYNSYDDLCYVSNIDQQEVCVSDYDVSGSHMIIL